MPKCVHKVMVVDDSRLMHSLYEFLLPDKELVHASDGTEAFRLLGEHEDTDLLLLDLTGRGLDAYVRMRRHPVVQAIPVVLVTSSASPEDVVQGLSAGAAAYLTKPFHGHQLVDMVEALLHGPASGRRA